MSHEESKRIRAFRSELVARIPRFPNTRETLRSLESEPLATVFVHYTNWAVRFVPVRPLEVEISDTARRDHRWRKLLPGINALLDKARAGEDLNPHLSEKPYTKGYTPKLSDAGQRRDNWTDKDQLLNVMGYHHFHLGTSVTEKGLVTRTKDLLFAEVTRDKFTAVGIFDHSVFEENVARSGYLSQERKRLWEVFMSRKARGVPPGAGFFPYLISSSGHATSLVVSSMHFARTVAAIDPQLEDPTYLDTFYAGAGMARPKNPALKWALNFIDLGLFDPSTKTFFTLAYAQL